MSKILVVDDEEPIVDAISYNLKKEGFDVETASDADECMNRFLSGSPDLVLLDVMLPSGNGLDLCRRLHRHNAALPVLLLTARAAEADCLRGFDAGADDYVVICAAATGTRRPNRPSRKRISLLSSITWKSTPTGVKFSKTVFPSPSPAKNSICYAY
jgi:CheY-like chemotaxis protein